MLLQNMSEDEIANMSESDMEQATGKAIASYLEAQVKGETVSEDIEQEAALAGLVLVCMKYLEAGVPYDIVDAWFMDSTAATKFVVTSDSLSITICLGDGTERAVVFPL